jgi:glycosyltransferase involved in cell wall biosynthesis
MNDLPVISVFMPAYNASARIAPVIEKIPAQLWSAIRNVWIVNDGSRDNTREVLATLENKFNKIHAIHFKQNSGYGAAVRAGIEQCIQDGCDYAVCLHADGQYPPEVIEEFVRDMVEHNTDILQGSRLAKGISALRGGMPLYKFIAGKILTAFENRIFGLSMTDYHSGFLIYSRRALESIPFRRFSDSFDFDLESIAFGCAKGFAIRELPIPTRYAGEKSYLHPVAYGLRVLWIAAKYCTGYYRRLSWYW